MQKVTIIQEYNCYDSNPTLFNQLRLRLGLASSVPCRVFMSVWLTFKDDFHDFTETGTRIIGPVPDQQADSVVRQLETAFKSAGFDVHVEVSADD